LESRFIVEGRGDPHADFALEEAIFRLLESTTVRVWQNELSVIIGRAQLARLETDVEYCRTNKIPIVRRFTAGGAVYNGPGNVNWSFFVPREFSTDGLAYTRDARKVFPMVSALVVEALRRCGTRAWFDLTNAIVSEKGKIGGMAAYISRNGFLCHGTLLVEADLVELRRLTTPSREVAERRYVRSRSMGVANTGIDYRSLLQHMNGVLQEGTGLRFELGRTSRRERDLAHTLCEERYAREEWNLGDPFAARGRLA